MIDERALAAEWQFERSGDGYIYYPGPHSRGVRVTAAERDVFIHGSTDDWLDIIAERERTEPPRPYWRGLVQRMQTTPLAIFVLYVVFGLVALKQAYETYADLPTADSYAPLTVAVKSILGLFLIALGVPGVWIAWRYQRRNVRFAGGSGHAATTAVAGDCGRCRSISVLRSWRSGASSL